MIVNREKVQRSLEGLDGEEALRRLLERELGYDYEGGRISADGLPADVEEELAADPALVASTARDGRFTVIHVRLNSAGKLSLTTERKIMERLKKSYPYSLYVFSDAEDRLWHFVNAPLDPEAQAPGNLSGRKQYRRIVVGPGESFRTATERISLLTVDDLAEKSRQEPEELAPLAVHAAHEEAFDVEAVTKEFFREYRRVFESVEESVTGIGDDEERRRYFVQRLFNRLMFVAFVEKKGWMSLRGRTDYLPALWESYAAGHGEEGFYQSRLKPLFFRGFNSRGADGNVEGGGEDPIIGVVPYLNGGLFEEDANDGDEGIDVPDGCLDEIVNGLFAGFNFTTTESTPLDVEVAVDPEMLGKVFEELITGRHEVGAYYTPKEIVSFMCREALKGQLEDRLRAEAEDDREAVRAFIEEHDPTELHDPEAALEALRKVRVCDPACGSGAYLLGMMRELIDLRESLFATIKIDSRTTYQRKLEIIQNNLYGVDLDPFAVNIARLRLWLSLVVDYEGETPPPLPNLDFKIEAGDSLTGPAPSADTYAEDMFRASQIEELFRQKGDYLGAHGQEKTALKESIGALRKEIAEWTHSEPRSAGFDWQVEFAEVFLGSGFDVVLANPPYLSTKHGFGKGNKVNLSRSYRTARGQFDAYGLFVERAFSLMAKGGCYAYIIPSPVLTNDNMLPVREIMQEHRLLSIARPGRVFEASVESIVIVGQKAMSGDRAVSIFGESTFLGRAQPQPKRMQDLITPANAWNISAPVSRLEKALLSRKVTAFGDLFDIVRGVECGKHDASISRNPKPDTFYLLRGEDVSRFAIRFGGYHIRRDADKKYKPLSLYEPPKLLIRRVSNNLVAAVDQVGYHVLNTIYVAKPKPRLSLPLEYVCALLNSNVMNEYFHRVYVNDDKLFPYIRKKQIESLPVAEPLAEQVEVVVTLSRELNEMSFNGSADQDEGLLKAQMARIDEVILQAYEGRSQT
jgi:hypothetical protein